MPAVNYSLERVGEQDLEVSWTGNWENITLNYKGGFVGIIPTKKEFLEGRQFVLPDGRGLRIWYSTKYLESGIYLEVNGEPVPKSAGDPEVKIENAATLTFLMGGIMVILGIIGLIFNVEALSQASFGGFSVVTGSPLLVLAAFILWRNRWALVLALGVLILDILGGTFLTVFTYLEPNISILVLKVLLLFPIFKALSVFNKIKAKEDK